MPSLATSQAGNYCLTPEEVDAVYIRLKTAEDAAVRWEAAARELNSLLQSTNDTIKRQAERLSFLNTKADILQDRAEALTEAVTKAKCLPKRFGIGFHAGYDLAVPTNGVQPSIAPYIGVGVSYNLVRF